MNHPRGPAATENFRGCSKIFFAKQSAVHRLAPRDPGELVSNRFFIL
jgi:hypothetical protein